MARWFLVLVVSGVTAALLGTASEAQPRAPSISFRNDLKAVVIVQGATDVKGMQRRGQPLVIAPGKIAYDINLPAGDRVVTVYDGNQTNKVLHRERIPVRNVDVQVVIRLVGTRIAIQPDTKP